MKTLSKGRDECGNPKGMVKENRMIVAVVPDLANSVRQMQPMAGQTIVEIIQAEGTENVKTFAACSGNSSAGKCESIETALTNG